VRSLAFANDIHARWARTKKATLAWDEARGLPGQIKRRLRMAGIRLFRR